MQALRVSKFGFRIRTRNGAVVDNLLIHGDTEEAAQHKLRQIYRDCEILTSWRATRPTPSGHGSFEDVVDLINR